MHKVSEALSQIAEIHAHLAKAEVYRGLRPELVATSGFVGIGGAALEPYFIPAPTGAEFGWYWLTVAVIAVLTGSCTAWYGYFFRDEPLAKRRARIVAGQMLPSLVVGALVTFVIVHLEKVTGLLPGIWAIIYSLGLFSIRPYMPRSIGWVALYFMLAGLILLWPASISESTPRGWGLAAVFALGQVSLGFVLYRNEQREFLHD